MSTDTKQETPAEWEYGPAPEKTQASIEPKNKLFINGKFCFS